MQEIVKTDDLGISVSEESYLHTQEAAAEHELSLICEKFGFTLNYYYNNPNEVPLEFINEATDVIYRHRELLKKKLLLKKVIELKYFK